MITISSLWLAILVAAVLVWIGSAIVWMVLPHHKKEYGAVPDEEAARNALSGIAPGLYSIPHAESQDAFKDPEHVSKMVEGPVAFLNVVPSGAPRMGKQLAVWFVYLLVVGVFVAYVAGHLIPPGAEYMMVFRFTSAMAFMAYALAAVGNTIWFGAPWSWLFRGTADALFYALLTGGAFGWLWP